VSWTLPFDVLCVGPWGPLPRQGGADRFTTYKTARTAKVRGSSDKTYFLWVGFVGWKSENGITHYLIEAADSHPRHIVEKQGCECGHGKFIHNVDLAAGTGADPLFLPNCRKLLAVANLRIFGHQRDSLGQCRRTNQAVARVARVVCRELVGEFGNFGSERTNRHS
jgi:hypothetical protein